jgi:hypothetical protein
MTDPLGSSAIVTAGNTAARVMASLAGTPTLLVMVILNIAMIGAAAWFLSQQETTRGHITTELIKLITVCLEHDKRQAAPP